jgi:hypothetical protein
VVLGCAQYGARGGTDVVGRHERKREVAHRRGQAAALPHRLGGSQEILHEEMRPQDRPAAR